MVLDSRVERKKFTPEVRLSLLETDMNQIESAVAGVQSGLRRLTMAIVGAALSFATAAVLLAINLAVSAGG